MDNLQSTYRINVAKQVLSNSDYTKDHYVHYFAVNIVNRDKMMALVDDLKEKYPNPKFDIGVTYWDITGRIVSESWK